MESDQPPFPSGILGEMRSTTDGGRDKKVRKIRRHPPSGEEASDGGGIPLKKGPWTAAEDAILVDYVTKHGEGNWNAVQKHSGLARCGKSCRLRWANHLRPDLKKGAFSPEEERLIIELHAKMGNKWARMAAELPGRTDNEIKNYWNTRIKRLQRTGMPIYPTEVCLQVSSENQETHNMGNLHTAGEDNCDLSQADPLEIPEVDFRKLELHLGFSSFWSTLLDVPPCGFGREAMCLSDAYCLPFPSSRSPKRLRGSETPFPVLDAGSNDSFSSFGQYADYSSEITPESFVLSSPYDVNPDSTNQSLLGDLPGSHAFLNGNYPSSVPHLEAMKSELPSLQYTETQQSSCGTPVSPRPSLEFIDPLIQSPPCEHYQSDCHSPRGCGLLEAVIYEAFSKQKSCAQTTVVSGNEACNSSPVQLRTKQEVYAAPDSPLGDNAISVLNHCSPASRKSFEEPQSANTMPGFDIKPEEDSKTFPDFEGKQEILDQMHINGPDALLDLDWCQGKSQPSEDKIGRADYIGALLGTDFY